MPKTIKLLDGREVCIDISRLTYLKIRELRKGLKSTTKVEENDPKVLDEQIGMLQSGPITHAKLLKAYYAIAATSKQKDDSEALQDFSDKMNAICCQWVKGKTKTDMSYEEYLSLPWVDINAIENEYNAQTYGTSLEGATAEEKKDFLAK